jgi:hypothetical protein
VLVKRFACDRLDRRPGRPLLIFTRRLRLGQILEDGVIVMEDARRGNPCQTGWNDGADG